MARRSLPILVLLGIGCLVGLNAGCASPPKPANAATEPRAASLLREGLRRAARGDALVAEQYLVAAWNEGEQVERLLPRLLGLCLQVGRLQSALGYVERAVAEGKGSGELLELEVFLLSSLGRDDAALERVRGLPKAFLATPRTVFLRGLLELRAGDVPLARELFRDYLRREPYGPHARRARALSQAEPQAETRVEAEPQVQSQSEVDVGIQAGTNAGAAVEGGERL